MLTVEIFGPPKRLPKVQFTDYYEGVDRAACTLSVPRELLVAFLRLGAKVGVTYNALAALALYEYLQQHSAASTKE